MPKLKSFEQAFLLVQSVVRNLKILAPSMLGAKMEGPLLFFDLLVRNILYCHELAAASSLKKSRQQQILLNAARSVYWQGAIFDR